MAPGTKKETTTACPNCDSAKLGRVIRDNHDWWCKQCGHKFNQPVERSVRGHRNGGLGTNTLAGKLHRSNPDSVGGDA